MNYKNYPFDNVSVLQQKTDFSYKNNTLVDNLNDNLLKENVNEYRLNIDSYDRDFILYPDPFSFSLTLAPLASNSKNISKEKSNDIISLYSKNSNYFIDEQTFINNTNKGAITKDFKNVKFVRLDALLMPRYNTFKINPDWDKDGTMDRFIVDENPDESLFNDRYVQLRIKELKENNNYSTNALTDNSFIVIPDKQWGNIYYKGLPYYAVKLYQDSSLGNLNKLSFDLFTSFGEQIKINTQNIDYELNLLKKIILLRQNNTLLDTIINNYQTLPVLPFVLPPSLTMDDIYNVINLLNSNSNLFKDSYEYIIKATGLSKSDIKTITDFINSMNYIDYITTIYNNIIKYFILCNANSSSPVFFDIVLPNAYLNLTPPFVGLDTDLPNFVLNNTSFQRYGDKTIDQYLNTVLWWDRDITTTNYITNIQLFAAFYSTDLFKILSKLKNEVINLPLHRKVQCHIMLVLGIWENELSTKINYR